MEQVRHSRIERMPPRASHNLFFALWPDAEVRAQIDATARHLKQVHASAGRWIKSHRYHLTLLFLGEHAALPADLIAAACAAGDRASTTAFDFALDMAASFANRKIPWWLGCREIAPGLARLREGLSADMRASGYGIRDEVDPVAHVTILRDAARALPAIPIVPIEWAVGEFVLIDSRLGPESGYTVVRRWTLRE
jgi:2'-5' RNA ligase